MLQLKVLKRHLRIKVKTTLEPEVELCEKSGVVEEAQLKVGQLERDPPRMKEKGQEETEKARTS